jgi:uncharacterized hydrophobic protein (TIGR00271 family)
VRELHIRVDDDEADAVTDVLEDHDIDSTPIEEEDDVLFLVPVPTGAVSTVLDELRSADVDIDHYTVMTKAEFATTSNFSDLRQRYATNVRKLSLEELHAKIREIQWPYQIYYVGTALSVIAAAAGLLLDQPALTIGAMIIAPQASSALAAPAGVLLTDWDLFTSSLREQTLGLSLAIGAAALFGFFVKTMGFVPSDLVLTQIELIGIRLSPTFLSTTGAVIAGVVGAFGYTTEQSTALIGVMIAAALVPAAASVGLAIAWVRPVFAVGAFLLLLVNTLAINVGALVTLIGMGYRPEWWGDGGALREAVPSHQRTTVALAVVGLVVVTVATGYFTAANIAFAQSVNKEVDATLDQPRYQSLSVSAVQTEYGGADIGDRAPTVTVRVSRTSNQTYSDIGTRLERAIERRTGQNVRTNVVFTSARTSSSSSPAAVVDPAVGPSRSTPDRPASAPVPA